MRRFVWLVVVALTGVWGCGGEAAQGEECGESGAEAGECEAHSVCGDPGDSGGTLECLKVCTVQADCPADQECNGVEGSSAKGCRPKAK